jgi:hypothetical protein
MNSCNVLLIKKELIGDPKGPAIHRGRGGFENGRRGPRGTPSSRGCGSGVCTRAQAGLLNFSRIRYKELISVIWNPAVETSNLLESESQLIVSHDFQSESVSSSLQETEVYLLKKRSVWNIEREVEPVVLVGLETRSRCY